MNAASPIAQDSHVGFCYLRKKRVLLNSKKIARPDVALSQTAEEVGGVPAVAPGRGVPALPARYPLVGPGRGLDPGDLVPAVGCDLVAHLRGGR